MAPAPTSYDLVPYDALPRYSTHPDCLAALATLLGMRPAPVARCRVLELGCSTGGNLLPLAEALPQSEFVGLDLSPRQIDMGRQVAQALGLSNLRLEARSLLEVDESLGRFDYVICHGVYSWVPAEVRDGLLAACRRQLAPQGVAYVSYNTYPGWHLRAPVRDMMAYHVRGLEAPHERAAQARALLEFLDRHLPAREGTWARVVRDEAELVLPLGDSYLVHEHLEADNHAVYFHQFVEHARRHRLQYLGEAGGHLSLAGYAPEVRQVLQTISADLLALEQYVDFLKCRAFRRTLLVREEVALNRAPAAGVVDQFQVVALARPVADEVDVCGPAVAEFKNDDDVRIETNSPVTKAALMELFEAWPRAVPFEGLWQAARRRLEAGGVAVRGAARDKLAAALVELYLSGLVGLNTYVAPFVTELSERPATTPLVWLQARTGAPVCNRRHKTVELSGLDRAVLSLLDGRRDRAGLEAALAARVADGEVELRQEGRPVTEPAEVRALVGAELEASLQRLARSALLVG